MITQNTMVLFDMDGTLTPPRENIKSNVISALISLGKLTRIGIISGSDLEYITEQCAAMFDMGGIDIGKVDLLPCNGTKLLRWKNTSYETLHEADMIKEIGKATYKNILSKIFEWQSDITKFYPDLPFTGTFVQYRGSLLNWCPIGRVANISQRAEWEEWDAKWRIRETYVELIQEFISESNLKVTVALGGSTSFDIYPEGWNKTYGLQHYDGKEVYFIGDRCSVGGNDWHLYKALEDSGRSWETSGPDHTIEIIQQVIKKLKQ
jgi:phosphomannomutase|tara:strand:+ start:2491 stop:3282 length:792 start_codon:yes stop_codon:yes gene_type:complete